MRAPVDWRTRLGGGVALGAVGFVAALLLDFDPQPLPYVVWTVVLVTLAWLVVDTVTTDRAYWHHGLPVAPDRVDEGTSDLRVLTSHQSADHPNEALAERLVALARARDPDLAAALREELDGVHRLRPDAIDRILTRIEATRDRT